MTKNIPLIVILLLLLISAGACSPRPEGSEPAGLPPETSTQLAATETPLPPTITPVPPTPTPAAEIITSENVQRLASAWDFPLSDDNFRAVGFSPDGRVLAAGTGQNMDSPDQKLRLFDVGTGQLLAESEKVNAIIWDLAYNPTGSYLAVGLESGIVQIRGAEDLRQIQQFYLPGPVNGLAFSPDGTRLAAGVANNGDGMVYILDLVSGEVILSFWAHSISVPAMEFSPDGSLLATGAVDRVMRVWDSATGELLHTLPQNGQGTTLAFSNNGGLLASGYCARTENYECLEGGVLLWSTTTWELFKTLSGPGGWVEDVAFSDADDLVAGVDRNGYLYFWQVNDGALLRIMRISSYSSEAIAISSDGRYLATGSTYTLSLRQISQ